MCENWMKFFLADITTGYLLYILKKCKFPILSLELFIKHKP